MANEETPIDWKAREERQTYQSIWKLAEDNSNKIDELEQQLAEAREELRIALAQRQDYRAHLTQARALLEEAEAVIDSHWGNPSAPHRSPHKVLANLRAFLASLEHEEAAGE